MDDETKYNLHATARVGEEMESLLKSEAFQTGLTLARARIFENWASSEGVASLQERELLHAEMRALERLLEGFREIDQNGVAAREAIRQMQESDTDL